MRPTSVLAWTNGELLIWMDSERGKAVEALAQKFDADLGVKVAVEAPQNITQSFPIAAQAGKDRILWSGRMTRLESGRTEA